jgi:hypothetical protein
MGESRRLRLSDIFGSSEESVGNLTTEYPFPINSPLFVRGVDREWIFLLLAEKIVGKNVHLVRSVSNFTDLDQDPMKED